jgi:hypothetical protein
LIFFDPNLEQLTPTTALVKYFNPQEAMEKMHKEFADYSRDRALPRETFNNKPLWFDPILIKFIKENQGKKPHEFVPPDFNIIRQFIGRNVGSGGWGGLPGFLALADCKNRPRILEYFYTQAASEQFNKEKNLAGEGIDWNTHIENTWFGPRPKTSLNFSGKLALIVFLRFDFKLWRECVDNFLMIFERERRLQVRTLIEDSVRQNAVRLTTRYYQQIDRFTIELF